MREVRYEYLKGREATRRLQAKPVGYLPIGALERHGDHLPMGLDVLKAHAVCCECARKIGGVVFPPHFYSGIHLDRDRKDLSKTSLARQRGRIRQFVREWGNLYTDDSAEEHLADVLRNLRTIGVRVLVLYTGHYPGSQLRMVKRLAGRLNRSGSMKVIPFSEPWLFKEGDHAGKWETSIYMAVCPEHVAMSRIGPRNFRDHGWNEQRDPRLASPAFGKKAVHRIVAHLRTEIEARM